MNDMTGNIVGERYRVEAFLGRGGMASVYKVWDVQRAAHLAMKVLHSDLADDVVFLRRFKREGQTLELLQHPNIVRFYGLEESDGLAYILMDYIEGLTLRREISLNKKTLRPARMLQILQPVGSALHYAHQLGMVHCDIKPVNILIQRSGMVYLTDFGIARVKGTRTEAPAISGTLAYMAPEQFAGEDPTPLSDQYALGIVLYEMITGGERPFSGEKGPEKDTSHQLGWEKQNLPAPDPAVFHPGAAPEISAVALRCLARNPQDRYPSVLHFLDALKEAVHGGGKNQDVQTVVEVPFPTPGIASSARVLVEIPHSLPGWNDETSGTLPTDLPVSQEPPEPVEPPAEDAAASSAAAEVYPRKNWGMWAVLLALLLTGLMAARFAWNGQAQPEPSAVPAPTITQTSTATPGVTVRPGAVAYSAATATATTSPTLASPTVTAGAQQIAFASDRGGSVQIWVMDSDRPGRHYQLTNLPNGACQPVWSPDNQKIAFITPCNGPRVTYPGAKILVVDLQTRSVTDINARGFDPDWSPDGTRLAYTTYNGEKTEIHVVALDTLQTQPLSTRGTRNSHADWSPDGITIAFTSDDNGIDEIWRMRADGSSQEVLTNAGLFRNFSKPDWSPDGEWLAASMKELDSPAPIPLLVAINPDDARDGGRQVLNERLRIEDAAISPDGNWFVFWYVVEGNNMEIARVNSAGEWIRLTDHKARDFHPAWSASP